MNGRGMRTGGGGMGGLGGGGGVRLGGIGGFGGRPAKDVLVLLAVVFVTFTLQFFAATAGFVALLRLTPLVWRGFLWQLATYPFIGFGGPDLWFVLEMLILFWFGRDVFRALGRRRFWTLLAYGTLTASVVAVAVDGLGRLVGTGPGLAIPFVLLQGQRLLIVILIAAFAVLFRNATILLMFVIPVQARWFIAIELLFAFLGYLGTKDLAGFLGICAAVAITWFALNPRGANRTLRESRLRLQQWWMRRRLDRMRKRRNLRVVPGDKGRGGPGRPGGDSPGGDPWLHRIAVPPGAC